MDPILPIQRLVAWTDAGPSSCDNARIARRRRDDNFAEWAISGTSRGVLGIILAVVAAYLVYRVAVWALSEAARQAIGTWRRYKGKIVSLVVPGTLPDRPDSLSAAVFACVM
jgi:hypothetical protein